MTDLSASNLVRVIDRLRSYGHSRSSGPTGPLMLEAAEIIQALEQEGRRREQIVTASQISYVPLKERA